MSPLCNDPRRFKDDVLTGLVAAYGRYLEQVPGASGVARAGGPRRGKVSVVIGGGAGHYPAFAGLVGEGLADAAVVGRRLHLALGAPGGAGGSRASTAGRACLFSFGNYAGDVLNFGLAERRLAASGIDCRTVLVTDDVASAAAGRDRPATGDRGDLVVFKAAGAAADRGAGLDGGRAARPAANSRTGPSGSASPAAPSPGSRAALLRSPAGEIELGLGIHGEPGIRTGDAAVGRRDLAERPRASPCWPSAPTAGQPAAVVSQRAGCHQVRGALRPLGGRSPCLSAGRARASSCRRWASS